MRKSFVMFSVLAGILVLALWSLPVLAAPVSVSDSDLAAISGKAATNGNVQYGAFDWNDDHSADTSDHKGANDVAGAASSVQQNVTATVNAINWGAYSAMQFVAGDVTGTATQTIETRATQDIGGF